MKLVKFRHLNTQTAVVLVQFQACEHSDSSVVGQVQASEYSNSNDFGQGSSSGGITSETQTALMLVKGHVQVV